MSELAQEFKKRLIWFSDNRITGRIFVKLSRRGIVYLENTEKVLLPGPVEEKADIPMKKCVDIVGDLMEENFFGDIIFNSYVGRVVEIGLMELYKPDEIEDRFPERRSK